MVKEGTGQTIEVVFEDGVLKPTGSVSVLREHERGVVFLYPNSPSKNIDNLHGTISEEEAEQLQQIIEQEFERIEGEW